MTRTQFVLQVVAVVIACLMLPFLLLWGCPDGCTVIDKQTCACDAKDDTTYQPTKTSDEKPPQNQQLPWQTGEVKADMPPSCSVHNDCSDQQAIDADAVGKRSAHVPQ